MRKKKPDVKKALKLLQQAYKLHDAGAAYALATWYLHGTHVRKNLKKGTTLLKEAVSRENIPSALYDLAVSYEKGTGTNKSLKKAYTYYLQAALWGEKDAFYEVGRCLYHGIGIKRDKSLANIWLDRAENLKHLKSDD